MWGSSSGQTDTCIWDIGLLKTDLLWGNCTFRAVTKHKPAAVNSRTEILSHTRDSPSGMLKSTRGKSYSNVLRLFSFTHQRPVRMHQHALPHPCAHQQVHSMGLLYVSHNNHMIQPQFLFLITWPVKPITEQGQRKWDFSSGNRNLFWEQTLLRFLCSWVYTSRCCEMTAGSLKMFPVLSSILCTNHDGCKIKQQ